MASYGEEAKQRALSSYTGLTKGLATFPSLDKVIYGLRKEMQIVLLGESKSGKSAILQNILFNALVDNMSRDEEEQYEIYINWFSLEMTGTSLFQRFMSNYLYTKYGIRYSSSDLEGYTNRQLDEDKIPILYDEAIDYVNKIAKRITIFDIPHNAKQITKRLDDFHLSHLNGKFVKGKYVNSDKIFVINIIDHMKLISPGGEADEYKRAEAVSKEFFEARNKYRCCNILLNQANADLFKEENRLNDFVPQQNHLYGGKGVIYDADLILSIGAPILHKLPFFPSHGRERYDIRKLQNKHRSLHVLLSRYCGIGGRVDLHSDFEVNTFSELPPPDKIDYSKY